MSAREQFTITLRALPGWPWPPEQRLRAGLKRLLRNHGLRCVSISGGAGNENRGEGIGTPEAPPKQFPAMTPGAKTKNTNQENEHRNSD